MSLKATDWAWSQKCGPMEKLILVLLAEHMNGETGRLNPGIERLMGRSGMSKQGVLNQIEKLENSGLLRVEHSVGRVNNYVLPVHAVDPSTPLTRPPGGLPPVHAVDYHPSTPLTGPVHAVDPNRKEPEDEPEIKPEGARVEKRASKRKNVPQEKFSTSSLDLPQPLNTPEFCEAWQTFCQHRKEIKKPFTKTAAEMALKKLVQIGSSRAIIALNHSAENGWQGIFEPKLSPTEAKKAELAAVQSAPRIEKETEIEIYHRVNYTERIAAGLQPTSGNYTGKMLTA